MDRSIARVQSLKLRTLKGQCTLHFVKKTVAHEIKVSSDLPAQIELKAEEDLNFLIRSENKDKGKLFAFAQVDNQAFQTNPW